MTPGLLTLGYLVELITGPAIGGPSRYDPKPRYRYRHSTGIAP